MQSAQEESEEELVEKGAMVAFHRLNGLSPERLGRSNHLPRLATTSTEQQRSMLEVVFREAVAQVQNVVNPSGKHPF